MNPGDICPDCERIDLPGALCPLHAGTGSAFEMPLRDWFAGMAMQGLIEGYDHEMRANGIDPKERTGFDDLPHPEDSNVSHALGMAREAYIIADAMLKARTEKEQAQ